MTRVLLIDDDRELTGCSSSILAKRAFKLALSQIRALVFRKRCPEVTRSSYWT
jgi:hypothetical protein